MITTYFSLSFQDCEQTVCCPRSMRILRSNANYVLRISEMSPQFFLRACTPSERLLSVLDALLITEQQNSVYQMIVYQLDFVVRSQLLNTSLRPFDTLSRDCREPNKPGQK